MRFSYAYVRASIKIQDRQMINVELARLNHSVFFQNITNGVGRRSNLFLRISPSFPPGPRGQSPHEMQSTRPDGHGDCHWWASGLATHCARNPRVSEQELTSRLWGGALIRNSFSEREFCALRLCQEWIWVNWIWCELFCVELSLWVSFILSRGYSSCVHHDVTRVLLCIALALAVRETRQRGKERVRAGLIEPSNR